jgi:two-component sensor histidine kinase
MHETTGGIDRQYAQDDYDAPRDARRAVEEQRDLPPSVRYDLLIVVTELLTNALRHSRPVAGGRIFLGVRAEPDVVHVEVRDPGTGFTVREPNRDSDGGFGLVAVDRISSDWGVSVTDTTLVWATIAIPD